jgi:hypothetical protein
MLVLEARTSTRTREEGEMIGTLLLHVLGELVFDAAKSTGRTYETEFTRYLEEHGFVTRAESGAHPTG